MVRLLVLMYHMVDEPRSSAEARFCTPPAEFARQMRHLAEEGFHPVGLAEVFSFLEGEELDWPERLVHVTFDDGFLSVKRNALPVLAVHAIPGSFFIVSDNLGGQNAWMLSRGFPRRRLMSAADLFEIEAAGGTIGCHGCTHARLTVLSGDLVDREVRVSKQRLESCLGRPIEYFAYPFGAHDDTVRDAVERAGYRGALSTEPGFNRPGQDLFRVRRVEVAGTDRLCEFRQKTRFGTNSGRRPHA